MQTTLDLALIRWAVVCRRWHELSSGSAPVLGAFLAGWFLRDAGAQLPTDCGSARDSLRIGYAEADSQIVILQRNTPPHA